MDVISSNGGAFIVNGKPTFLYGAECHYFRIDPELWRQRLDLIRRAGFNLVSTYVPWMWHEPAEGQFDFIGDTHPRRNLQEFLRLCAEMGLFCIVRPGPYVMSELKNEGIPEWLLKRYPEVIARTATGDFHPTRVVSYLHPTFLGLVELWYEQVIPYLLPFLVSQGGNILMFQLDNEIGMLHWVTNTSDYNRDTLARFAEYCQSRNLEDSVEGPKHEVDLAQHWQWSDFYRDYIAEYIAQLKAFADQYGIDVPYIVNVHGFKDFSIYSRGVDYPIGLSQLSKTVRVPRVILAGDFYPGQIGYDNAHDLVLSTVLTEAVSVPGQPIFSAEFQSGRLSDRPRITNHDLELLTRICVAHGMNALNYYMFCGGDNPEGIGLFGKRHEWQAPIGADGSLSASYYTAQALGRLFTTFNDLLCSSRKTIDTHIGFYSPYYMTETADWDNPVVGKSLRDIATQREHMHFDGIWRLLAAANISFRALDIVLDQRLDPIKVPSLWIAATQYMDRQTQERLKEYVVAGGKMIIGPRVPEWDLDGTPCRILADAIGLGNWTERTGFLRTTVLGVDSVFCRQHLVIEGVSSEEIIAFGEGGADEVAGFIRPLELGCVVVLGVGLNQEYDYSLDIIRDVARCVGIEPRLSVSNRHVFASERTADSGVLVFLNNPGDSPLVTTVERSGVPAFGGNAVVIGAKSGVILPVDVVWQDFMVAYSTLEIDGVTVGDDTVHISLRIAGASSGVVSVRGAYRITSVSGMLYEISQHDGGLKIQLFGSGTLGNTEISFIRVVEGMDMNRSSADVGESLPPSLHLCSMQPI